MEYIRIGSKWGDPPIHNILKTFLKYKIVFVGADNVERSKQLYNAVKEKVIVVTSGNKVVALAHTTSDFDNLTNFTESTKIAEDLDYNWFKLGDYILAIKLNLIPIEEYFSIYRGGRIHFIKDIFYKKEVDKLLKKYLGIKIIEENIKLLGANRNLILTGAPGTGKTYLAKQIAYKLFIGDKKLSEEEKASLRNDFENQCGFVQFHPSYDYTDFVEGLRPVNNGESNIGFERRDGVFKEFCKRALENYKNSEKDLKLLNLENIVKNYLIDFIDNINKILTTSSNKDFVIYIKSIIEKSNNQSLKEDTQTRLEEYEENIKNRLSVKKFYPILGISELVAAPIVSLYRDKDDKLVLQVDTENNYKITRFEIDTWVKRFIEFRKKDVSEYTSNKLLEIINDDQSKIELIGDKYKYKYKGEITYIYGFLRAFYDEYNDKITEEENKNVEVKKVELKNFVFIIDEINRGEISKIFGELFFSIDPGYRGKKGQVKTQYQNLVEAGDCFYDGFFVPENVYIIGTMNDIDRSVESMDFAMRRRFAFVEVEPEHTQSMLDNMFANIDNDYREEIIKNIKERMDSLNKKIVSTEDLSKHYQIGASYFLKLENYYDENKTIEEAFESLWKYHLKGLLAEYLRGVPNEEGILQSLKDAYDLKFEYDVADENEEDNEQ